MSIQGTSKLSLGSADVCESLGTGLGTLAIFLEFFASSGFLFGLEFLYTT